MQLSKVIAEEIAGVYGVSLDDHRDVMEALDANCKQVAVDIKKRVKALREAKKAGGHAMQFDPDASPEEKAAQARAVCSDSFL